MFIIAFTCHNWNKANYESVSDQTPGTAWVKKGDKMIINLWPLIIISNWCTCHPPACIWFEQTPRRAAREMFPPICRAPTQSKRHLSVHQLNCLGLQVNLVAQWFSRSCVGGFFCSLSSCVLSLSLTPSAQWSRRPKGNGSYRVEFMLPQLPFISISGQLSFTNKSQASDHRTG